jgi:hypothetical protein
MGRPDMDGVPSNDNSKSNDNGKSKDNSNGKMRGFFASLRMTSRKGSEGNCKCEAVRF